VSGSTVLARGSHPRREGSRRWGAPEREIQSSDGSMSLRAQMHADAHRWDADRSVQKKAPPTQGASRGRSDKDECFGGVADGLGAPGPARAAYLRRICVVSALHLRCICVQLRHQGLGALRGAELCLRCIPTTGAFTPRMRATRQDGRSRHSLRSCGMTLRRMTLRRMTLRRPTLRRLTLRRPTLRRMTLRRLTLRRLTLRRMTLRRLTSGA
jgi:hypothetical protein